MPSIDWVKIENGYEGRTRSQVFRVTANGVGGFTLWELQGELWAALGVKLTTDWGSMARALDFVNTPPRKSYIYPIVMTATALWLFAGVWALHHLIWG